jgi:two-component system chemotaxis response regulator CheB
MTATEQRWCRSRHRPNIAFDVVALEASPGGPKAGLPTDFPASVLVVQRLCPDQPSPLADILSRRTALMVEQTVDGDVLRPATVLTPVPERHLPVRPDGTVSQAPRIQSVRPLYDVAFALRTLAGRLGGW